MTVHRQVVAGLIRRDDEVLLVRQQGPNDPCPIWSLPGGKVEAGEFLPDALRREIREETGLTLAHPGALIYVTQWLSRAGEMWTASTSNRFSSTMASGGGSDVMIRTSIPSESRPYRQTVPAGD